VPDFDLDASLKQVAGSIHDRVSLPPAAEIRRLGQRRGQRRAAVVSGSAALAVALVAGVAFGIGGDGDGGPPVTDRPTVTMTSTDTASPSPSPTDAAVQRVTAADLLRPGDLPYSGPWREVSTDQGLTDTYHRCQGAPSADERHEAAFVRRFAGPNDMTAVQAVEVSRGEPAAVNAYRAMWATYDGCAATHEEVRLRNAWRIDGIGDEASAFELVSPWSASVPEGETYHIVLVARTGRVTTAVILQSFAAEGLHGNPDREARTLATAVDRLCPRSGGACLGSNIDFTRTFPEQTTPSGWLQTVDLPVVPGLTKWQTGPVQSPALDDSNGTVCEERTLADAKPTTTWDRQFDGGNGPAEEPTASELVGRFASESAAAAYVDRVGAAFDSCGGKARITNTGSGTWVLDLRFDANDGSTGRFLHIGVAQNGTDVVILELSYDATAAEDAARFRTLLGTARDRLPAVR